MKNDQNKHYIYVEFLIYACARILLTDQELRP